MDVVQGTQSVSRAFGLVDLVVEEPRSLQDLCRLSGLTRPTAVRLLNVLEQHRYVRRIEGGRYDLGIRYLELSARLQSRLDLVTVVSPFLEELAKRYRETTFLCVRDGRDMVCVARLESPHAIRLSHSVGARTSPHAGALGKVLLAFAPAAVVEAVLSGPLERLTASTITEPEKLRAELEAIRAAGYAESEGEGNEGASAVAAPIRDAAGEVIAAIAVAGPSERLRALPKAELCQSVLDAAMAISAELGWLECAPQARAAG